MKTIVYILLLLGGSYYMSCLNICFAAGLHDNYVPEIDTNRLLTKSDIVHEVPAALNEIPDWVKEKVTLVEYEMLKLISTRFRIDYSFLREDVSSQRRVEINRYMETLCQMINKGRFAKGTYWIWSVAPEENRNSLKTSNLQRLSEGKATAPAEEVRAKLFTVYSSPNWNKISVKAIVSYIYNTGTCTVSRVKVETRASADVPDRKPDFSGQCRAEYNTGTRQIQGACAGTLSYTINNHRFNETLQNVQFIIAP